MSLRPAFFNAIRITIFMAIMLACMVGFEYVMEYFDFVIDYPLILAVFAFVGITLLGGLILLAILGLAKAIIRLENIEIIKENTSTKRMISELLGYRSHQLWSPLHVVGLVIIGGIVTLTIKLIPVKTEMMQIAIILSIILALVFLISFLAYLFKKN